MEFKDDGKPKQITWRVFQLVPKPETPVWLLFNKKSERKMKTMNLSLNLLLFFFKNRVSMIWLTARPSKLDRDSNVTGFSRSDWSRRIKKLTKRFNLKIPGFLCKGQIGPWFWMSILSNISISFCLVTKKRFEMEQYRFDFWNLIVTHWHRYTHSVL